MLKEALYSEYQKRYKEYKKKHEEVDNLEEKVKELKIEKEENSIKIENEKKFCLDEIINRKNDDNSKLASVKKSGTDSAAFKDYNKNKLLSMKDLNDEIDSLENQKTNEVKELQNKKKETIKSIEKDKNQCQKRLDDLTDGGNQLTPDNTFDADKFRLQLDKNKENEVLELRSQYDATIEQTRYSIQNLDAEYTTELNKELAFVEKDKELVDLYYGISSKQRENELPHSILRALEEPIENVIQRNKLSGGKSVSKLAKAATPLDDLNGYMPKWLEIIVMFGLPCIVGVILFLIFLGSGTGWGFVATLSNAIASLLFWILCAAIGFGILYGVVTLIFGDGGIIGGIIGAIIGLLIGINWGIELPSNVTDVVEWIIKVIICLVVIFGMYMLLENTKLGTQILNLCMKLGFVKNAALARQEKTLEGNRDSYYCLIRYSDIIGTIVNNNKLWKNSNLNSELGRLESEKAAAVENLVSQIDADNENKISGRKAEVDSCLKELFDYNLKINDEEASYDNKIKETNINYDNKVSDLKAKLEEINSGLSSDKDTFIAELESDIKKSEMEYTSKELEYNKRKNDDEIRFDKNISECLELIDKKEAEFADDLKEINDIFYDIDNKTVGFDESKGVLSDYIYLYNKNSKSNPKELVQIKHDKKPIVFLYDLEDTTNISASLKEFINAVLEGLYIINSKDTMDVIITDPVTKARPFEFESNKGYLTIQNDIKVLSKEIQDSMRIVSQKGKHIDEYNREMSDDGEDKGKFLKYKIVEFIVPEEAAAQNTDFFDSDLWGTLGDGNVNGFIPIFYINYSDWKDTFDDDNKMNSKFVLKLKNAIGSSNGQVFKIDTDNIKIQNMN